jgi:hypothetical protein
MSVLPRWGRSLAFPGILTLSFSLSAQDPRRAALDQAVADLPPPTTRPTSDLLRVPAGDTTFRLVDVSLDALMAFGSSTERDASLATLKGGAHDPRKRGATIQNVEVSLLGAVDPYFDLETHIAYALDPLTGESVVELEEAFATTQALPAGLQVKAGHYFTEFGRINAQHPHAWDWQDQPVIATRLFGGDGLRAPGARVSWLTPLPWYLELTAGLQNANGETATSFFSSDEAFGERPIGGRAFVDQDVRSLGDLLWSFRAQTSFDVSATTTAVTGGSLLLGPNATGSSGDTLVWGADLKVKWRPTNHERGWPFVLWQGEIMGRAYDAAAQVDENDPTNPGDDVAVAGDTLRDFGLYAQVLWGFQPRWSAGLRVDWADGSGQNYDADADAFTTRDGDPFRNERLRISPLLAWQPTEFSRIRLQYDYDDASHLEDGDAHTLMLGVEVLIGKHPAHRY